MVKHKKIGLPKRIYVKRDVDENDHKASWLVADEHIDAIEDGAVVGIYELIAMQTKHVSHNLS